MHFVVRHIRATLAIVVSLVAMAPPMAGAAINLDLSYVNTQSNAFSLFKGWVDRAVAGNPGYDFAAADAAYMYKLSGQAQYCNYAVQMVDTQVTTAETAINAQQNPEVARDSYLYVGTMISDVALTYDWCSAQMTSAQRTRWSAYAEQAIYNVWNPSLAKWGGRSATWSGWGTSDPANNYHYSFLEATMYWVLAYPNGPNNWRTFLQNTKLPALEAYFATLPGGGSEEGTGYGTSHMRLFALYRLWRDATGVDMGNANSHMTDTISYWIHATVPMRDRFQPFGDQARTSVPNLYDYQRRLVLEARQMTNSAAARDLAAWWLNNISIRSMTNGFNYRYDLLDGGTSTSPPAPLVYQARGVGHLFARTGWDTGAMWLAFSAGRYVQSHAHQDQGSFTLFEGDWLAVTENIWTRSGIQQGTNVHNVVRFERNGTVIPQRNPTASTMTVNSIGNQGEVNATGNLTPAYAAGAGVTSWTRNINFALRKLTVQDNFVVTSGTQAIFQVNVPVQPGVSGNEATAGRLHIRVLSPANATLSVVDWRTAPEGPGEFLSGWRVEVRGGTTGYTVELSTDGDGSASENVFSNGFD
jgi:hypothetical protein